MSDEADSLRDWLAHNFTGLPRSTDEFFVRLWRDSRLRFCSSAILTDELDLLSSQLVCATLDKQERLLIILPDRRPHRSALLFAIGLIMNGLDRIKNSQSGGQVLYFSSKVGIRDHLSNVRIGNLTLDTVFAQAQLKGHGSSEIQAIQPRRASQKKQPQIIPSSSLPKVICVYALADPIGVLERHQADWIAIDCGDELTSSWLPTVLKEASARRLPVLAWGQNALSENVTDFIRAGIKVFQWPHDLNAPSPHDEGNRPTTNRLASSSAVITPLLLEGERLPEINNTLQSAFHLLIRASKQYGGRLNLDALRLSWKYFRSVEALSVPFELHEAEAPRIWGLNNVASLHRGVERFIDAIRPFSPPLSTDLEQLVATISSAVERMRSTNPPLWDALTQFCVSDVPDGTARLLVFPSRGRKQLFTFSLLARYNISEDDLHELGIWLMYPNDLYSALVRKEVAFADKTTDGEYTAIFPDTNLHWEILFVGLPSPLLSARLEPALRRGNIKFLIYEYQSPALARRVNKWDLALRCNLAANIGVLSGLSGRHVSTPPHKLRPALKINDPEVACIEPVSYRPARSKPISWEPIDPTEEVAWLLSDSTEEGGSDSVVETTLALSSSISNEMGGDLAYVERVIQIHFNQGWYGLFAPDEKINTLCTSGGGDQIEGRYVRSLRRGDRVLLIHGQRRQSLYELVISRVHQHPAIELHLARIRRWQNDFLTAYGEWQHSRGRNLNDLLSEMRRHGSQRESTLTLRQWLRGDTLCPLDPEDLRRLADILNMGFVRQNYKHIYRAAMRLRSLHKKWAIRLNRWLLDQASGNDVGNAGEIFDQELGLSLQDFRDSLLILRVESVEEKSGLFLRTSLGGLERGQL